MGVPPDQPPLPSFHNSSAVVPKGPIPVPVPLTLWPVAIESSSHSAMYPLWSVCCCVQTSSRGWVFLWPVNLYPLSMCLLMSCVLMISVVCHITMCSASQGVRVAWVHGPVALARSQPGAFLPGQWGHLFQPTTAASGPSPGLTAFQGLHAPCFSRHWP